VTWMSHGDKDSKKIVHSNSNSRAMFVLSLTKAKILDYSIVPAVNSAFPLCKTINLSRTAIVFLQTSLQLKLFQKAKK